MSTEREKIIKIIREELPKLFIRDQLFRTQILGIMTESLASKHEMLKTLEELKLLREDFNKESLRVWEEIKALRADLTTLREDFNRETAKIWEEIKALRADLTTLREDFNRETAKIWEEIKALRSEFTYGMENFRRYLQALGARWGIYSEEAFRNGVRGLLEEYFGAHVKKWLHFDSDGIVFGRPSEIDIDVVITDAKHILIEIKSSVSKGDVSTFLRKSTLYKKVERVEPELIIVSPYVDEDAKRLAEEAGIKIYTRFEDLRRKKTNK